MDRLTAGSPTDVRANQRLAMRAGGEIPDLSTLAEV
jgi:hypothetical protein